MYVKDNKMSLYEIDEICEKIQNDSRFLILVKKEISLDDNSSLSQNEIDYYYTKHSEDFFNIHCKENVKNCQNGFLISIYTQAGKIRIVSGSVAKNVVTIEKRNSIINSIRNLLRKERYSEGIIKAVEMIQSYSYNTSYNNPTYIKPTPKKEEGSSFGLIFIFLICPCLLCCCYFAYKKNNIESQEYKSGEDIHIHLNKLENLLNEIKKNNPNVISINECLICMNKIIMQNNFQSNYQNISTTYNDNLHNTLINPNTDTFHTRFTCGHVFHNLCLNKSNLTACIMCIGNVQSSIVIQNTHETQVIDEMNIKNIMKNLHLIYGRDVLEDYSKSYPNEFNNYNNNLALGLVAVWGVTAVVGTAYMMSDMTDYSNYNNQNYEQNYNQNYGQSYNDNYTGEVDTAEGDF